MPEAVSLNGQLVPSDQACVSVFDSGFMQGIGLFETLRAYNGVLFRLERHVDRLLQSARALGWSRIPDEDDLALNAMQATRAAESPDARVRLTVTTGSLRAQATDRPELTIVAVATPGGAYPADYYERGITVDIAPWRQSRHDPLAGHKTTSYYARMFSLLQAYVNGASETLWLTPEDQVAEGAISSVFVVRGEDLYTPPLDTPIVPGIGRATVIELAAEAGLAVHEQPLRLAEAQQAEELFLTNSVMEVMPVVRIGRTPVGKEKPGPLTRQLAAAYRELVARECGNGAER